MKIRYYTSGMFASYTAITSYTASYTILAIHVDDGFRVEKDGIPSKDSHPGRRRRKRNKRSRRKSRKKRRKRK